MQSNKANLAAALKTTANRLESGEIKYVWSYMESCNCGILAQTLLAVDADELDAILCEDGNKWNGIWDEVQNEFCDVTSPPIGHVVRALYEAGLTPEDMAHLEYLTNPDILGNMPPEFTKSRSYCNPTTVVAYMRTWATMLEKEVCAT